MLSWAKLQNRRPSLDENARLKPTYLILKTWEHRTNPIAKQLATHNCHSPTCTICWNMEKSNHFFCTQTKHTYKVNYRHKPNCQIINLIYLLTCRSCGIQYVGETKRTFNARIKEHLADIKHARDKPVAIHMQTHKNKAISFQIIHIVYSDPEDQNGTTLRKQKELYWIHQLRTPTPRGLNFRDNVKSNK